MGPTMPCILALLLLDVTLVSCEEVPVPRAEEKIEFPPAVSAYVDIGSTRLDNRQLYALPAGERIKVLEGIRAAIGGNDTRTTTQLAEEVRRAILMAFAEMDPSLLLEHGESGRSSALFDVYPDNKKRDLGPELIAIIRLVYERDDEMLRWLIKRRLSYHLRGFSALSNDERVAAIEGTRSRYYKRVALLDDSERMIEDIWSRSMERVDRAPLESYSGSDLVFSQRTGEQVERARAEHPDFEFAALLVKAGKDAFGARWYDSALEKWLPALEIYRNVEDKSVLRAAVLSRVGRAYVGKREFGQAVAYLQESVAFWQTYAPVRHDMWGKEEYLTSAISLGQAMCSKGDRSKGWETLRRARAFAIETLSADAQMTESIDAAMRDAPCGASRSSPIKTE